MPDYRRPRDGKIYFFTVVTHMRQPILCTDYSIKALEETISQVRQKRPFEIKAWVVLPEHMHTIWELPDDDTDYSVRWALIKKEFTKKTKGRFKTPEPSRSRMARNEATVWQRRFWEHKIRDDSDFRNHMDYIHYNPVKHGLVSAPGDWKHSSFKRYVDEGLYHADWGAETIVFADGIGAE